MGPFPRHAIHDHNPKKYLQRLDVIGQFLARLDEGCFNQRTYIYLSTCWLHVLSHSHPKITFLKFHWFAFWNANLPCPLFRLTRSSHYRTYELTPLAHIFLVPPWNNDIVCRNRLLILTNFHIKFIMLLKPHLIENNLTRSTMAIFNLTIRVTSWACTLRSSTNLFIFHWWRIF